MGCWRCHTDVVSRTWHFWPRTFTSSSTWEIHSSWPQLSQRSLTTTWPVVSLCLETYKTLRCAKYTTCKHQIPFIICINRRSGVFNHLTESQTKPRGHWGDLCCIVFLISPLFSCLLSATSCPTKAKYSPKCCFSLSVHLNWRRHHEQISLHVNMWVSNAPLTGFCSSSGYQRQLNYKHSDGAYSTFGAGAGNTWWGQY